jgi:hypothetical protein
MGLTTIGKSICAAALAGSYTTNHYIAVGIGSTAYASGNTALVSEVDRNQIDTNDLTTAGQVTFIANWSPIDISGCILKEHGMFTLGSAMLCRNVLTGSLVFDGEQELQIQQTIRFLI